MSFESNLFASWTELERATPAAIRGFRAVGQALAEADLDHRLTELIKVRVSQINGCAFCLHMHLRLARQTGVAEEKLDLLASWRDASSFSDAEAAALGWAEAVTRISTEPAPRPVLEELRRHFTPEQIAHLTATVALINAWNRLLASLHIPPQHARQ